MKTNFLPKALALGFVALVSACSAPVARYDASYDNVQVIKGGSPKPVAVDAFKAGSASVNDVSVRSNTALSPVGTGFQDYLQSALEAELKYAELLDPAAMTRISGVLKVNDISAAGISENSAKVGAEFTVLRNDKRVYQKQHVAEMSWESSFVGAVAIPRALQAYPKVVEKLLRTLYSDPDFQKALTAPVLVPRKLK